MHGFLSQYFLGACHHEKVNVAVCCSTAKSLRFPYKLPIRRTLFSFTAFKQISIIASLDVRFVQNACGTKDIPLYFKVVFFFQRKEITVA